MGWLRLDDAFGTHPKILGLSDRTFRAHLLGMLYAAHNLTDGFVHKAVGPPAAIARDLVEAGLWAEAPNGWVIHDFLEYNPSKAEVKARAKANAMAGAKGAAIRWGDSETVTGANSPAPPVPSPRKKPSKPRPRDIIGDALARVEGADPSEVPSSYMRTLCIKANELRQIAPNVTPEEVLRRAANWGSHMRDATITGPAVVKYWGRLVAPARSLNGSAPQPIRARLVGDLTDEELAHG